MITILTIRATCEIYPRLTEFVVCMGKKHPGRDGFGI
jgi:hypothetical protein